MYFLRFSENNTLVLGGFYAGTPPPAGRHTSVHKSTHPKLYFELLNFIALKRLKKL
jgi:hypothetical protein